jgi:tRNA(Ile)-lysidine synthase
MLRGCGPAGLAGIYDGPGAIIRPLLDIRRTVLRDYLSSIGQIWREDVTNQDTARQRARIREKLLPVLERDFSPRAVEQLATLARLSREEQVFWKALIEDRFGALATQSGNAVSISIVKLLSPLNLSEKTNARSNTAMRSLTERLVRRLYQEVRGNLLQLTSTHVQQVIRLAQEGMTGKVVALPGRILVTRNFERLTFSRRAASGALKAQEETQSRSSAYHYAVPLNACGVTVISVPELGACFRLKVIDCPSAERETTKWPSILDLDTLRQPLVLRNWQPGDGYTPRGRRKKRKLKEMFLSARIASSERCRWPVLESDGNVVWARGIGPADEFSVREGTLTGVLIEECKL